VRTHNRFGPSQPAGPFEQRLKQKFPNSLHRAIFGLDNFRILARSRITLNKHIDAAENDAGNMRLFEATGMGACLLTDWKPGLQEIFEPDVEVVAYKNIDECVEKVRLRP
jgi:spore maturation protein CgeB